MVSLRESLRLGVVHKLEVCELRLQLLPQSTGSRHQGVVPGPGDRPDPGGVDRSKRSCSSGHRLAALSAWNSSRPSRSSVAQLEETRATDLHHSNYGSTFTVNVNWLVTATLTLERSWNAMKPLAFSMTIVVSA